MNQINSLLKKKKQLANKAKEKPLENRRLVFPLESRRLVFPLTTNNNELLRLKYKLTND